MSIFKCGGNHSYFNVVGAHVNLTFYFITLSFLSSITFDVFKFFYHTLVCQNGEKLSLGVVKVGPRIKTSILDHDNVVKFCSHFSILKLA